MNKKKLHNRKMTILYFDHIKRVNDTAEYMEVALEAPEQYS